MAYCLYYCKTAHCTIIIIEIYLINISSYSKISDEALKFYLYNYTKCMGNWFPVE